MYQLIYKGLSKKEKEYRFNSAMAIAHPSDKRGRYHFTILEKDPESVKEEKRKRIAAWMKKAEAELQEEIEKADAQLECRGVVLPKGKPVEVADDHPLCEIPSNLRTGEVLGLSKAQSLAAAGVIELQKVGSSLAESSLDKRGPGRPRKLEAVGGNVEQS